MIQMSLIHQSPPSTLHYDPNHQHLSYTHCLVSVRTMDFLPAIDLHSLPPAQKSHQYSYRFSEQNQSQDVQVWKRGNGVKHDNRLKEIQLPFSSHPFSAVAHSIREENQSVDKKPLQLIMWDCTLHSIVLLAIYFKPHLSYGLSKCSCCPIRRAINSINCMQRETTMVIQKEVYCISSIPWLTTCDGC